MSGHSISLLSPTVLRAFEFAAFAHKDQKRRGGEQVPYFSHPAAVGLILGRAGFEDEVVIAGVLHDVVEDTPITLEQIEQEFGSEVAHIVDGVSEDKSLPYVERKKQYIERIRAGSSEVKAVSCADKIANLTSVVMQIRAGEDVFKTIWTNGPGPSIQFYSQVLEAVQYNFSHPVVQSYEQILSEFIMLAEEG